MPINRDDLEQGDSPITPPEGDVNEREMTMPEPVPVEPEPNPVPLEPEGSSWNWIGSPSRPEAQESSDGISDLFEVGEEEDDASDLLRVDIEKDILDAGPEGDLSDLVEVSEEDILGDEETGQIPLDYKPDAPRRRMVSRRRSIPRYAPPTSLGGMSG